MLKASRSSPVMGSPVPRRPSSRSLDLDALALLGLRFVAHLPYFKAASALILPQGLSNAGVLVTTLAYAAACFVSSRWIAGLRRMSAELPHPAVLPLLGTTAVLIAMLVLGPAVAALLPRHPELASAMLPALPAYLVMLAPACGGFFAAQYLNRPRRTAR